MTLGKFAFQNRHGLNRRPHSYLILLASYILLCFWFIPAGISALREKRTYNLRPPLKKTAQKCPR